ncbi:MAG TPA: L-histidine N(alpha)-methyltransferase [Microlunatus sp.]
MITGRLDVHLSADDLRSTLIADARQGLTSTPKTLPAKYFYDPRGSELFEVITALPEYYPTRTEEAILARYAAAVVAAAGGPDTLIELGSGSSTKTRLLLEAMTGTGRLRRYVPVDVSASALDGALSALAGVYPGLELHGVVADFEAHLDRLPPADGRLIAFLGSTIGNLDPAERSRFFRALRAELDPGDAFLLGVDLIKDESRLIAAYDDAAGVTADFNRNVLRVLNASLGADFRPEQFDHVARWNAGQEWMEMALRARHAMTVTLPDLDLRITFAAGEDIRTEISAKFRRPGLTAELATAGFTLTSWWTDPAGDFALALSVPDL